MGFYLSFLYTSVCKASSQSEFQSPHLSLLICVAKQVSCSPTKLGAICTLFTCVDVLITLFDLARRIGCIDSNSSSSCSTICCSFCEHVGA